MEFIFALADTLWALVALRYMFAGILFGTGTSLIYERISGDVVGDTIYLFTAVCAFVGIIFDIRRGLRK